MKKMFELCVEETVVEGTKLRQRTAKLMYNKEVLVSTQKSCFMGFMLVIKEAFEKEFSFATLQLLDVSCSFTTDIFIYTKENIYPPIKHSLKNTEGFNLRLNDYELSRDVYRCVDDINAMISSFIDKCNS